MHPNIDLVDEIIRIFGYPALLTAAVWAIRKYDKGERVFKEVSENTKLAVAKVAEVKTEVDSIKENHLAHLQEGISNLVASNDEAVKVLQTIDRNIAVLVDRSPRV